jgi:hypothetical protein
VAIVIVIPVGARGDVIQASGRDVSGYQPQRSEGSWRAFSALAAIKEKFPGASISTAGGRATVSAVHGHDGQAD